MAAVEVVAVEAAAAAVTTEKYRQCTYKTEQYGIQLVFALRLCAEHILSCIHSNYEVWVPSFLFRTHKLYGVRV